MLETEKPIISLCVDDLNSSRAIGNAYRTGLPMHGSVIVTNDERFRPVRKLVEVFKDDLARFQPGVHVSLFVGTDFPDDHRNFFGDKGYLRKMLDKLETIPEHWRSNEVMSIIHKRIRREFQRYEPYIAAEINRQIDFWTEIYGTAPYDLDYHYGLHMLPFIHGIYVDVASGRGIPYRHASQYTGAPKKGHMAVFDKLNTEDVNVDFAEHALDRIHGRRYPTQIMLHLGEYAYGEKQTAILNHPRIRRKLDKFRIMMPHEVWPILQNRPVAMIPE